MPTYPNVPNVPGVPAVLRAVGGAENNLITAATPLLLTADAVLNLGFYQPPVWGIYQSGSGASAQASSQSVAAFAVKAVSNFFNGTTSASGATPVVTADNVISFEYKQDWTVADFPIENGGFQSYNKVQNPFIARVRFSTGGSLTQRQALLNSIAAIAGTTQLFDVVTPEQIYTNVNVTHYDYKRTASEGAGLIQVDIWLAQVRINTMTTFSQTAAPSGANQINNGVVSPITPAPNPPAVTVESIM